MFYLLLKKKVKKKTQIRHSCSPIRWQFFLQSLLRKVVVYQLKSSMNFVLTQFFFYFWRGFNNLHTKYFNAIHLIYSLRKTPSLFLLLL